MSVAAIEPASSSKPAASPPEPPRTSAAPAPRPTSQADRSELSEDARTPEGHGSSFDVNRMFSNDSQPKNPYTDVTVQKWGSGQNDCVWNALKGAGYTDQEIKQQGLVDQVAQLNHLKDPNIVQTGQHLRLPTKGEGGAPGQESAGGVSPVGDAAKANPNGQVPDYGPNANKAQVGQELDAAAKKYGIPPDLLKAVAWQESTWDPHASSFDGGHGKGVMQIDDRYHDFARTDQVWDSGKNIDYGAKYLSDLHNQNGSWDSALQHYNGGSSYPGTIRGLEQSKPWQPYEAPPAAAPEESAANGGGGGLSSRALHAAEGQMGVTGAADPGAVKQYTQGRSEPWCADFVSWSYEQAGGSPFGHQPAVASIRNWGKDNGLFHGGGSGYTPHPGDVIIFGANGDQHTGLVKSVDPDGTIHTVEGNTGPNAGESAYQGAVASNTYSPGNGFINGFVDMSHYS